MRSFVFSVINILTTNLKRLDQNESLNKSNGDPTDSDDLIVEGADEDDDGDIKSADEDGGGDDKSVDAANVNNEDIKNVFDVDFDDDVNKDDKSAYNDVLNDIIVDEDDKSAFDVDFDDDFNDGGAAEASLFVLQRQTRKAEKGGKGANGVNVQSDADDEIRRRHEQVHDQIESENDDINSN